MDKREIERIAKDLLDNSLFLRLLIYYLLNVIKKLEEVNETTRSTENS